MLRGRQPARWITPGEQQQAFISLYFIWWYGALRSERYRVKRKFYEPPHFWKTESLWGHYFYHVQRDGIVVRYICRYTQDITYKCTHSAVHLMQMFLNKKCSSLLLYSSWKYCKSLKFGSSFAYLSNSAKSHTKGQYEGIKNNKISE